MTNMTIEQFRLIYDDWNQSGLSVKQYCENTGLTEGRFYYWRAKIQAESLPSSSGSFIPVKMSGNTSVCSAKNASGKALCEIEYPTLNSLKILQESSKIPRLTPRIQENPPKFLKYLLYFRSILTIRGLPMAYFSKNAMFLRCFFKNNANPFQNRFETDLHCV